MGYFIPFVLLFIFLFFVEWFLELVVGLVSTMAGSSIQPDFPGPTNLIQDAIYLFPDVWDLGSAVFFGTIGQGTFLLYVLFAILDGIIAGGVFLLLKNSLYTIASDAISRAGSKFGTIGTYDPSSPTDETYRPPEEEDDSTTGHEQPTDDPGDDTADWG